MNRDEYTEDSFDVQWNTGRMNRNPGLRKMKSDERPMSDKARQAVRSKGRVGKEFNRNMNG